ncbi:RNA polymerase sigma-70 factor [Nonomuraea longicatena]|uniref:RNA polymerase sigma-70 factor n=1 Tax=Nonomuraea longicatena TaxID=83682 RepID=A0ABP3YZQ6_9ACTN
MFEDYRPLLTGVAYRVLGSMADAEDVVQEAWLRWSDVDQREVADPRAYLTRVTTRLAVDRLRWARSRREAYVGPWLPEPVSTVPDVADQAVLSDSVELAMLVVLETLSPLERAVFVLREAFGLPFAEIAEVIGRAEPATRQLARRARDHVQERRPRFETDAGERRRITERFLAAAGGGDLADLIALLSADVSLVADGGGKVRAPLRVLHRPEKVARFLASIATAEGVRKFTASAGVPTEVAEVRIADVNGGPAVVVAHGERVLAALSLVIVAGRIQTVYLIANPEKLGQLVA